MSDRFGAPNEKSTSAPSRAPGSAYRELTALLKDDAREILADIWHVGPMSHPKRVEKVERQAEKRAIEVARYVLPVAAATTMVHTLSGIVLHRLWRMQAGLGYAHRGSRGDRRDGRARSRSRSAVLRSL